MMQVKVFFQLVKRELHTFFINPVMYFSCFFLLVSNTINFFYVNNFFVFNTGSSDLRYFFNFFPISFILVIPALTMGLWRKDDFETMFPVSSLQFVVAKWLSVFFIIGATVFSSLALVFVVSLFGKVEISLIVSSTLGIVLLTASLCALGQLCTIFFRNQAASFFVAAVIFAVFLINGYISRGNYFDSALITDIAHFLSFSAHFDAFSKGIIDTRNVLFFAFSTLLFIILGATLLEVRKYGRQSRLKTNKYLQHICLVSIVLILASMWNSTIFYKRFDMSENKEFSLSEYSENVINSLDSKLSITYYVSPELVQAYPQSRDIEDFLYEYSNYSGNIKVQVINPDSDTVKNTLTQLGITQLDIPSIEENKTTILKAFSAVVLEYKNNTEVIPFLIDTTTLEYDIVGRLQSLTHTLFRSAFLLVGNGLSLKSDYPLITPILESAGFSVRELSLDDILQVTNIDTRTPLVVLGSSLLNIDHVQAIKTFIDIGGKVLLSVSPITVNLDTWEAEYELDYEHPMFDFLERYGFEIAPALIHDENNLITRLLSNSGKSVEIPYPFFVDIKSDQVNTNEILGQSFRGLSLLWPSPISKPSTSQLISPLVYTSSKSWLQSANKVLYEQSGDAFITNPFFEQNMNSHNEIVEEQLVVATYADSIVVVSDQYFLSRGLSYVSQEHMFENFDFLINSLLWLQNHYDLINIKSKSYTDYSLQKIADKEQFSMLQVKAMFFLFIWYIIVCVTPFVIVRLNLRNKKKFMRVKK